MAPHVSSCPFCGRIADPLMLKNSQFSNDAVNSLVFDVITNQLFPTLPPVERILQQRFPVSSILARREQFRTEGGKLISVFFKSRDEHKVIGWIASDRKKSGTEFTAVEIFSNFHIFVDRDRYTIAIGNADYVCKIFSCESVQLHSSI